MIAKSKKFLHKPFRILWFETDEIFLFFLGIVFCFHVTIWFLPITIFLIVIIRRSKEKQPRGFLKHIAYQLGLMRFKGYPSFFEDRFNE